MDIESLRLHCISKPGTTEEFPFDNDTLVFKVMGKIFALVSLEKGDSINLKCDPEYALELREQHPEDVIPGYHMNKKHWNTVYLHTGLREDFIRALIDHSYERVVAGLPKKVREELEGFNMSPPEF